MEFKKEYLNFLSNKKPFVRNSFSPEEDEHLKELVKQYGTSQWNLIASKMNGRDVRQCRERYLHYLDPTLNQTPWTKEEDELLTQKVQEYGHKWKLLEQFFDRRTDISIKNRWNKLERVRNRVLKWKINQKSEEPQVVAKIVEPKKETDEDIRVNAFERLIEESKNEPEFFPIDYLNDFDYGWF